eukprot:758336-Hanusia_phi.AAC.2
MPTHRMVSMEELTQYLHLPEKTVAKELGICLTSLKKLCRQHGITRWPYRKKIAKAENGAGTGPEDAAALKARADELKKEKMQVAFTYGLKDPNHQPSADGVSSPATSECPMQEGEAKPQRPKKKAAVSLNKVATSSVLLGGKVSSPKNIWPFSKELSGIPTPPDEPLSQLHNEHGMDSASPPLLVLIISSSHSSPPPSLLFVDSCSQTSSPTALIP